MKKSSTERKRWREKDWYAILAPKEFKSKFIDYTPATDAKDIIGRKVEVDVSKLTGNMRDYYMKIAFKIIRVEGKNAATTFAGFECTRSHVYSLVRKWSRKITCICDVETTDKWLLRVECLLTTYRKSSTENSRLIRKKSEEMISKAASRAKLYKFVDDVIKGEIQKRIKEECRKLHPMRFVEIIKIKVLREGEI